MAWNIVNGQQILPIIRGQDWASQMVLVVKNPSANADRLNRRGFNPRVGRYPGGGHGNPLQHSCLATSLSSLAAKHKDDSVSHTRV